MINNLAKVSPGKSKGQNSIDPNQTAPKEQSDLGPHNVLTLVNNVSKYMQQLFLAMFSDLLSEGALSVNLA